MIEKLEKYIINRLDNNIELNNTDVEIIKILIDNKKSEVDTSPIRYNPDGFTVHATVNWDDVKII